MKKNIFTLSFIFYVISSFCDVEVKGMDVVDEDYLLMDADAFRQTVSVGVLNIQPLQKHSYDISWSEFKKTERKVCENGTGTPKDWVILGLAYRFGIPNYQVVPVLSEARSLLIKTAYEDRDISAIYHVACMVIDGEIINYHEKIKDIMRRAYSFAMQGNADFLTLMLERDHSAEDPILTKLEYKASLRRIISSHPNARAYIALAESTDAERFPGAVLGHYRNALHIEPDNIIALLGAGDVIDNGLRRGVIFPEGIETAEYYFLKAYRLNKNEASNSYGSILYERAATLLDVTKAKKLFKQAKQILEEDARVNADSLLSLADYHAIEHSAKPAKTGDSFDYINRYLKHRSADLDAALEVLRNLKGTMETLERSGSNLFRKIQNLEIRINESLAS